MNFSILSNADYAAKLYKVIAAVEGERPLIYIDGSGLATIGTGFLMNGGSAVVLNAVFKQLGFHDSLSMGVQSESAAVMAVEDAYRAELQSVFNKNWATGTDSSGWNPAFLAEVDEIMNRRFNNASLAFPKRAAYSFSGAVDSQGDNVEIKAAFEAGVRALYEGRTVTAFGAVPDSIEKIALFTAAFLGIQNDIKTALGNKTVTQSSRAEVWFAMRSGALQSTKSRVNVAAFVANEFGWAKRNYFASQLFGLYKVRGQATADEARETYSVLTRNLSAILQFEQRYGEPVDGSAANRSMIPGASVGSYGVALGAAGRGPVESLFNALMPARNSFIAWVNTQLPSGEAPLIAAEWNPAALAYNDPNLPQPLLDARSLDGKGNDMDRNLLVGNDTSETVFAGQGNDVLFGGKANDTLYGGTGNDTLYGGEDDDVLTGEAGNDRLVGGTGNDSYNFAGAFGSDVVEDSDGAGSVKVSDTVLTGGKRKPGESTYRDEASSSSYVLVGSTLLVTKEGSPQITIKNWSKSKNLGITLVEDDDPPPPPAPPRPVDPLVIDLDGDGLELRAADGQVLFDHNADGIRTGTGWASPDDALLVWDRNANGLIDTGRELFGIDTLKSNGQVASNGFDALADLDSDADGRFSSADAQFNKLRLWRDLDQDGVTDAGELQSLSAAGIASISLATSPNGGLINNNRIDSTSVVTRADGSTTTAGAIDFAQNLIAREFTPQTVAGHVAITPVAQGLPELTGSGMVRDVREAASLNTPQSAVLVALLQQYSQAATRDAQLALLQPLLDAWAATSTHQVSINTSTALAVTANGPGSETAVQAWARLNAATYQHAATLERFYGSNFLERLVVATPGGFTLDVSWGLPASIDQKWQAFQSGLYSSLILQTRLKPFMDAIVFVTDGAGPRFDTTALSALISARGLADQRNAIIDLFELNKYAAAALRAVGFDLVTPLRALVDALAPDSVVRNELASLGLLGPTAGVGSAGSDIYFGDAAANFFYGDSGDDLVSGGAGDDRLFGDAGEDLLDGGAGNDSLSGGAGNDLLYGGAGNDNLDGDLGNNIYKFGRGDGQDSISQASVDVSAGSQNTLQVKPGVLASDVIAARAGADLLLSIAGTTDQLRVVGFFIGNDPLSPTNPLQRFQFSDGEIWSEQRISNAAFKGTALADSTTGTIYSDVIGGLEGNDTLAGMEGDDTLSGGEGSDTMYGGGASVGQFDGNDALDGDAGDDSMLGGLGNDLLRGGAGNDQIRGGFGLGDFGDGDDTIDGGAGNDYLLGGLGSNTYLFGRGDGEDRIAKGYGEDGAVGTLIFKAGVSPADIAVRSVTELGSATLELSIVGTADRILISGFEMNFLPSSWGYSPVQQVVFEDGTVWSASDVYELLYKGTPDADILKGTSRSEAIHGQAGNDTITGVGGDDQLFGGEGDDVLKGDDWYTVNGDDVLDGGAGNDSLDAAAGHNTYVFGRGDGQDILTNLNWQAGSTTFGTILFKAGVLPGDVVATSIDDMGEESLLLSIAGTNDSITVKGFFKGGVDSDARTSVHEVQFSDGTKWDLAEVLAQAFKGTAGADNTQGSVRADVINGQAGDDSLFGQAGGDTLNGGDGNDLLHGDTWNNNGQWFEGNEWSFAPAGNDRLNGGAGDDFLSGDLGDDTLDGGAGNDTLLGGAGISNKYLYGRGDGQDVIWANYGAASSGRGTLEFKAGIAPSDVTLRQDNGDLVLEISCGTDRIVVQGFFYGDGVSSPYNPVQAVQFADGTVFDANEIAARVFQGTSGDDAIRGFAGADFIAGQGGNDTLDGSGGADTIIGGGGNDLLMSFLGLDSLVGGAGNDTYLVHTDTDVIVELANEGVDLVQSNVSFTLAANVEALELTSEWASAGTGNSLDNLLTGSIGNNVLAGGAGNDTLIGNAGVDTLIGGVGNDYYVIDVAADVITEQIGEGTDSVSSTLTLTLANNLENLYLGGSGNISGTGNALDNMLLGNAGRNALTGAAGNDTLDGGLGIDTLVGGAGNDTYVVDVSTEVVTELSNEGLDTVQSAVTLTLGSNVENLSLTGFAAINGTGNTLNNVLTGNVAANTLNGGTGTDTMLGGAGNDTYLVDATTDVVTELANEGADLVQSTATYTLSANVENLTLTGSSAINGTGNALDNTITGTSANNTLTGGAGNDVLDGGLGNDTMLGGAGNDTYVVNVATDVVTELANEGVDTVQSAVTLTLTSLTLENLTLTGSGVINGTGNANDNVLVGNGANNTLTGAAGNDRLDGGLGNDTMVGGAGNDVYVVNVGTDVTTENTNEGTDTVQSAVAWTLGTNLENLTLTGSSAVNGAGNVSANVLVGNGASNLLSGLAGNDTLDGGAGNDTLNGAAGADTYLFARGHGVDTVQDNDSTASVKDRVQFAAGIAQADLSYKKVGNNLEATIIGSTDKIVVQDWYLGTQYHVEEFRFNDGSVLTDTQVQNLVSAMALFSAPGTGAAVSDAGHRVAQPVHWAVGVAA